MRETAVVTEGAPSGDAGRRRRILVGLLLVNCLTGLNGAVIATAAPALGADLGGSSMFPFVFSAHFLAAAVVLPASGKLADQYGRRTPMIVALLIFLIGSVLCGLAWNMLSLISFRVIQGLGVGAMMSQSVIILGDLFTGAQRARAQAWVSVTYIGTYTLGPLIGGLIIEYSTWRGSFLLNLPVTLVALLLLFGFKEDAVCTPHRFDVLGTLLLTSGVTVLMVGLTQGGVWWAWGSRTSVLLFATTVLLTAGFIACEYHAAEPIVPPWIFRSRLLCGTGVVRIICGAIGISLPALLPCLAQAIRGVSPVTASASLTALTLSWSACGVVSAHLALRIGVRNTVLWGSASWLVGGLLSVASIVSGSFVWLCLSCGMLGIGVGFVIAPTFIVVQEAVSSGRRGVATSTLQFAQWLGGAVGTAALGALINRALSIGRAKSPHDLASGLASADLATQAYPHESLQTAALYAFWAVALLGLVAATVILALSRDFRRLAQ